MITDRWQQKLTDHAAARLPLPRIQIIDIGPASFGRHRYHVEMIEQHVWTVLGPVRGVRAARRLGRAKMAATGFPLIARTFYR